MSEGAATPPARALWERVINEMNIRGWTKIELAAQTGLGRNTVDLMKTNRRPPLARTVNKLADVLDIPRKEAYRLAGLDPSEAPEREASEEEIALNATDADIERLEELLAGVSERRRRRLEQIRDEERERFNRQLAQAREDYRRSIQRIEEEIQWEIEHGRKPLSRDDDDDTEGERTVTPSVHAQSR
ncbi:helix-turn-helix domain-containing protein [Streptosporangium sp. CA-135522]|uniref:helix-turn-helix domain-containing protein n=1 Tax=Streptosporangium sp. CA-135522 TaxID=3240072 RepID=UPI003D94F84F